MLYSSLHQANRLAKQFALKEERRGGTGGAGGIEEVKEGRTLIQFVHVCNETSQPSSTL